MDEQNEIHDYSFVETVDRKINVIIEVADYFYKLMVQWVESFIEWARKLYEWFNSIYQESGSIYGESHEGFIRWLEEKRDESRRIETFEQLKQTNQLASG